MEKVPLSARVGEWYANFKASPWALGITGVLFVLITVGHTLWGWDHDYDHTLYYLSWEATLSTCLLVADIARNETHRKKQERLNRKLLESVLHLLEAHLANTEEKS